MKDALIYTPSRHAVFRRYDSAWLMSDLVTREHIELDASAMIVFGQLASGAEEGEWTRSFQMSRGWVRTHFDPSRGLWADPTCLGARQGTALSGARLTEELRNRYLLTSPTDMQSYNMFCRPLTSALDTSHLGTFNQRLGQYLIRDLRLRQTWRWWHDQKFFPDGLSLRPGPYRDVQEFFFDSYFDTSKLRGKRVLDFACGNGHYSKRFAEGGACVIGVDTCKELIELAKFNHGGVAKFVWMNESARAPDILRQFADNSFDIIYLSDIFLILAEKPEVSSLVTLLREFKRLLSPRGRVHMMEPSGLFWLSPRIGTPDYPLVVVTEHREKMYNVAPTLERVCRFMAAANFALVELQHPLPSPHADADIRSYGARFPMWDFTTWMSY